MDIETFLPRRTLDFMFKSATTATVSANMKLA
jgi:hypothetical protein